MGPKTTSRANRLADAVRHLCYLNVSLPPGNATAAVDLVVARHQGMPSSGCLWGSGAAAASTLDSRRLRGTGPVVASTLAPCGEQDHEGGAVSRDHHRSRKSGSTQSHPGDPGQLRKRSPSLVQGFGAGLKRERRRHLPVPPSPAVLLAMLSKAARPAVRQSMR